MQLLFFMIFENCERMLLKNICIYAKSLKRIYCSQFIGLQVVLRNDRVVVILEVIQLNPVELIYVLTAE